MATSTNSEIDIYSKLKPEDYIRGETPANIKEKCLELCRSFIGKEWNFVTKLNDINVTRIIGGLSNQLYRVQLKKDIVYENVAESCYDVAIKLYQPKIPKCFNPNDGERLNDTIVLTLTSLIGLGPKVFGIFNDGVIQAYYKHCVVGAKLSKDISIHKQIVKSLAVLHHLSVPICKQSFWQLHQTEQMLSEAFKNNAVLSLMNELSLETFKKHSVVEELSWLKMTISNLQFPLVFSHNDFLGTNMLITEPDGKLLITDLEYSTYGCRGFDISNFMSQYGCEPNEYAKFALPDDNILKQFIQLYIDECEKLFPGYSNKQINSIEKILHETKLCKLVSLLFWTAFFIYHKENVIKAIPIDMKANFVSKNVDIINLDNIITILKTFTEIC